MKQKSEQMTNEEMVQSLLNSQVWIMFRLAKDGQLHIHAPNPQEGLGLLGAWFSEDDEGWAMLKSFVEHNRKNKKHQ